MPNPRFGSSKRANLPAPQPDGERRPYSNRSHAPERRLASIKRSLGPHRVRRYVLCRVARQLVPAFEQACLTALSTLSVT